MKVLEVTIKRSYKRDFVFCICAYLICFLLGSLADGRYEGFLFGIFFVVVVTGECLIEKYTQNTRQLNAEFQVDRVVLTINGKAKILLYEDIIEVQKTMKITRYNTEKGSYRIKVKTKRGSYRFYTPSEDYEMHLNFEETELASLYKTFGEYGIKCC